MLPTPAPLATMEKLVTRWAKTKDDKIRKEILQLLEDRDYQTMGTPDQNYVLRNRPFITPHKLKAYRENPYFAWMQYEEEIIIPMDRDYFIHGQAVDDLLTLGEETYAQRYEKVKRRSEGAERIQLTESAADLVAQSAAEYRTRHFFPEKLVKQNIIFLALDKYPFKVELDHIEFGSHFGDLKTTANIETFDPMKYGYPFVMGCYFHAIEEVYGEKLPGRLYVVDKNREQCRSDCFQYSVPMLEEQRALIIESVDGYMTSRKTGEWKWKLDLNRNMDDRKTFFRSQFYSHPLCKKYKDSMQPISL